MRQQTIGKRTDATFGGLVGAAVVARHADTRGGDIPIASEMVTIQPHLTFAPVQKIKEFIKSEQKFAESCRKTAENIQNA